MTRDAMTETLRRLDADWAARTASDAPVPRAWPLACPALAGTDRLADVLVRGRRQPDAVLLALLRLHATGDPLAGRVVVQAMLPKMVRMACRDAEAGLPDYLAALWERICAYPLERRPRRIAANLALDTLKLVKARHRCRATATWPGPVDDADAWGGESVLELGERLGYIDATVRTTLRTVYLDGRSSAAAASELGTTSAAVRQRCSKGVRALRSHAVELARELAG